MIGQEWLVPLLDYFYPWANWLLPGLFGISLVVCFYQFIAISENIYFSRIQKWQIWTPQLKTKGKLELKVKEYRLVLIGAILGFIALIQYPPWFFFGAWFGSISGYGYIKLRQIFEKKRKQNLRRREILLVYETVSMYSALGYSLYECLSNAMTLVDEIKVPLERCLRFWGQGSQRALMRFGKDVDLPEADVLVGILQRAANIGIESVSHILAQEGNTMEKIRAFRAEQELSKRPIILTVYLFLPGIAFLGATLMPVGYYITQMIQSINLS
jgi:hypothetical protein